MIKNLQVKRRIGKKRIDTSAVNERSALYYVLGFDEFDESLLPLLNEFIKHIEVFLRYWVAHHYIEVVADFVGANSLGGEQHTLSQDSDEFVVMESESGR